MKKVVLFFAMAIAAVSVSAQKVNFGVKAGINISNIKVTGEGSSTTYDSKVGLVAGGFAEIGVAESFSVQPELLFSMEGAKVPGGKYHFNFINVPVLAKYKLANVGLGIYAGPQIGFLATAKAKGGGETVDIKDEFKSTAFSGVAGVEYTFMECIIASARYQMGLSNTLKDSEGTKLKNHSFQITLGYCLGGKKK